MSEQSAVARTEERRRVIDRALDQRPDLEVDDLLRILDRLGVGIDEATLVQDLDALGFDVVDDTGGDAGAPGPAGDAFADPLADRRDGDAPGTGAAADDDADVLDAAGEGGPGRRGRGDLPLIIAAGVVLLALIVAVLVLGGGDDGGDPAGELPGGSIPVEPSTTEATTTQSTVAMPTGPAPDPALSEPDVALTFDTDSAILPAPGDAAWTALSGDFEVRDGVALSTTPDATAVVAVFPTPGTDARAQLTLPQATDGAGLVFGADDTGYYAWVAVAESSRVDLLRVTDAGRELVVSSDPIAFVPGLTLGVNLVGPRAEVLANGVVVGTTEMAQPSTSLGMGALTEGVAGVFDDLYVQYP